SAFQHPTHHGQATRTTTRKSSCRRGTSPRHLKAIATEKESTDEHSRSANCHLSRNSQLHRASATDSRRPADPTSRMGRAKWRIPLCDFYEARPIEVVPFEGEGVDRNYKKNNIRHSGPQFFPIGNRFH